MHYFDWTATTPISQKALDVYNKTSIEYFANPSSSHVLGLKCKEKLEEQRKIISSILKTNSNNIYFTSGGTESDSIILNSLLNFQTPGEIITTSIEHSAVLEHKNILEKFGWKFTALKCPNGYLDPKVLKESLSQKTRMVCFMTVNNVTGTVLDTKELVKVVREFEKTINRKIHIHCDAVQALGKIEFYPELLDIDSAAFSSHKFSGPRGVGILYLRNKSILSLSRGGGQEKGIRPGTENLASICAMTCALQDAVTNLEENYKKVLEFRKMVESSCLKAGFSILSPSSDSDKAFSPYILCISAKGLPSEVFLRIMGDKGFCLSSGSACSSNSRGKAESVLSAMNFLSQDRMSAIRISFGALNTNEEVKLLCQEIENGIGI